MAKFTVRWQAADGSVGKSRPHTFTIDEDDFEADDPVQYLEEMFFEYLEDDFRQKVTAEADNFAEFIEWALERQKARGA